MNRKIFSSMWARSVLLLIIAGGILYLAAGRPVQAPQSEVGPKSYHVPARFLFQDYNNIEIIYSSDNGSLPPQYRRERVITLTSNASGQISAEDAVRDYDHVLQRARVRVSSTDFKWLADQIVALDPESRPKSIAGCTGGTTKSVKISQSGRLLFSDASYTCAGKSTNESIEAFSRIITTIVGPGQ